MIIFAAETKRSYTMFSRRFLRIKVVKAIYSYLASDSDSLQTQEKNLIFGIDKAYELYFSALSLAEAVRNYAEERIEIARNKKLPTAEDLNPNLKFIRNQVIAQLADDAELNSAVKKNGLLWSAHPELVKHLYTALVESDYYAAYMASPEHTYSEDRRLVEDFYVNTVQDDQKLLDVLEECSIMWCDDLDFILIMVLRTLSDCRARQTALPLLPEYKNDDDLKFAKRLFASAAANYKEYLAIVEKFTQNWDVERIALMDNIIMVTAIAELMAFDTIPVKVTLDEYIEIAKYYSTTGSSTFINGILDKIVESLTAEGKINKSGRGLVDL